MNYDMICREKSSSNNLKALIRKHISRTSSEGMVYPFESIIIFIMGLLTWFFDPLNMYSEYYTRCSYRPHLRTGSFFIVKDMQLASQPHQNKLNTINYLM